MNKAGLVYHVIALLLGILGTGFIAVSQATASWLSDENNVRRIGIYQACLADTCNNFEWEFPLRNEELMYFITRIILLCADLFLLTSLVLLITGFCLPGHRKKTCLQVTGSFQIIAGALIFGAVIVFTVFTDVNDITLRYDYGYAFCWVAGFLFILAGAIAIYAFSKGGEYSSSFPVITRYRPSQIAQQNPAYNPEYD